MKKLSLLFVASVIAVGSAYACGGGDEPAKNPNDVASASASTATPAASSADVMPSATASVTASATATTPPPPPEPAPLAVEGIKVSGKGKDGKALAVEVKADGSVLKDGKTAMASFVKNELKDDKGATIFTVGVDGKVMSPAMPNSTWAFNDKDELQSEGKTVLSVGDDGVVSWTHDGKTEKSPFKFEKLPAKSKRAALLLAAVWWLPKPAAAPAGSASAAPSAKPSAAPSAKPSAAPSAKPK
jgi:predicted lipoprotein with Yx(FWY)xxD motif